MEYPEEQYHRLSRILLSSIGLWPYSNPIVRQIQVLVSLLLLLSFFGVQLMALFVLEHTLDLILEILAFNFLVIQWSVKYITFYAVMENIKKFQEYIRSDWDILKDDTEIEIIRKHANVARIFSVFLALCGYIETLIHVLTQYVPILLDIVIPLNESRPRQLLVPAEYFIDQQKYFSILSLHTSIGIFLLATIGIATETFSFSNALHAFGMFKVTSYRMEHILRENDLQICMAKKYTMSHDRIIAAVETHRRAIKCSELLKASFGVPYLFVFMIAECSASMSQHHEFYFQLFRIITIKHEWLENVKIVSLILIRMLFIIVANLVGQQFINYDNHVHRVICNTRWYTAPVKTQKLIYFLIQKTTKVYQVDAGGMFSPCLEGLARAMSMLFSFFTVLCSVQ